MPHNGRFDNPKAVRTEIQSAAKGLRHLAARMLMRVSATRPLPGGAAAMVRRQDMLAELTWGAETLKAAADVIENRIFRRLD